MTDPADKHILLESAAFRRFLFDLIQRAGLFDASASSADGRTLYLEGRRSLVLEILRDLEEAQPDRSAFAIPVLTLIQTLREQVQSQPMEKRFGRRNSTYADLGPERGGSELGKAGDD
ncbi:Bbp19 family protein [Sphingomonas alpina]|uniref:Bbp19-like phage domain-containing protein n=1 Tax=Sphingomonas alpina TaxID=653931 RepID=A0A7H0LF67_9SPHN|nr:hypothetical protein [Sphingomonas alpina]QNQ08320.1 hypothetical protein H3Z74_16390 [Sphingomonas alpina]